MYKRRTPDEEVTYFLNNDNGAIHLAWRRILSSPILDTKDRLGLKVFSAKTEHHLAILLEDLNSGKYHPTEAMFMYGPKDNKAIRIRSFLAIRDRLVYQAIGNIILENCYEDIIPFADNTIFAHVPNKLNRDGSYSDFTFRRTFSTEYEKGQYDKFLDRVFADIKRAKAESLWMMETDVASFYPSLDHQLIAEMLKRRGWLNNQDLINLLLECLSTWCTFDHSRSSQGVPVGYETSELLATLFLLDIDLQQDNTPPMLRRFVDDTYVFFPDRVDLNNWFVNYELSLQKRSLILNTGKTKVSHCGSTEYSEQEFRKTMRGKLSYIKNVQSHLDEDKAQEDIFKLFRENVPCSGECDEIDVKCIREHSSIIAFVLWRLRIRDETIKRVALCVLDELPSKSLHATEYLSQFYADDEVIDKLLSVSADKYGYSLCKIDCIRALVKLHRNSITPEMTSILIDWIKTSNDWYLRDAAVDILAEHNSQWNLFFDIAQTDQSYLVRAKCLFRLSENATDEDLTRIINLAFADPIYTVQALGVYIFRRSARLSRQQLETHKLSKSLEDLVLSTEDLNQFSTFASLFQKAFEITIPADLLFIRKLPNIEIANQMLLNLQDATSDPIDYVKALHEFMRQFLISLIRVNDLQFEGSTFLDILATIHRTGQERSDLLQLRLLNEYAQQRNRDEVNFNSKKQIFERMKTIIGLDLYNYLEQHGLQIPDTLATLVKTRRKSMRDKVFISYSHDDKKWFNILQDHLHTLRIHKNLNVWSDEEIETGQIWRAEIDKALAEAKVAVLLVTRKFLRSDFINSTELPEILRGAKEDGLTIIWIAVSASTVEHTPIYDYQCVNNPNEPVNTLNEGQQEKIFVRISNEIFNAMQK